ncbi:conserved hypothetical protein [Vibrio chagasii]|nr:conserved hypothetical protein [Vibrio chagasii]
MAQLTKVIHVRDARTGKDMQGIALDENQIKALASRPDTLKKMGIGFCNDFQKSAVSVAMDTGLTNPVTTAANGVPVQFLQEFLPGVIHILTAARLGDVLAPVVTAGKWSDEEIVITAVEHLGTPALYKDHGDIPIASWNQIFERRDIIRFELGLEVNKLEDARSNEVNINSAQEKRAAVALAFEIIRNQIFFNGYNSGTIRTFGVLNDPNLPAFVNVDSGVSGDTLWSEKTVAERISDLVTAISALRRQSGSRVDPEREPLKLAVASDIKDLMNDLDEDGAGAFGLTVNKWLKDNYPNITVEAIPEFNGANGGENVFYLYPETVPASGTDDGRTIVQVVPSKMQALNSVVTLKGTAEGYTSATAGCITKRGYAVVRMSGV